MPSKSLGRNADIRVRRSMPLQWPPFEARVCNVYLGKSTSDNSHLLGFKARISMVHLPNLRHYA